MRIVRGLSILLLALAGGIVATGAGATTTINKQFTPATIDPGDVSRIRIAIFNSSLVPLTAAAVTDNLPAQIAIANPPNVADTCGFATIVAAAGTQSIRLSSGTVPAGSGTTDGTCYFEADVISTTAGNWANTIPANGPSNGFVPGGATPGYRATEGAATVTNTTPATATLAVRSLGKPTGSKTFAPSPGLQNEPITLSVVLTNPNAGSTIPLTTFTDNLPAGMLVAATPSPTINCTGTGALNGVVTATAGASSVVLTSGTIGAGGACTMTAKVVVATITGTSQVLTNTIPANAIGNVRALTSLTFNRAETVNSPVTLAKSYVATVGAGSAIATPVNAGQEVWVRLDVGNTSTANPIVVTTLTDSLPSGLVVGAQVPVIDCVTSGGGTNGTISAVVGAGSFTVTNATVGITGGTRRCRISVPVVASAAGTYANTIAANSIVNAAGLNSPSATATLTVNSQLTVSKTVNPSTAAPGQPVKYTIKINNYSTGAVSGVAFTDTLPSPGGNQMVVSNPNGFTTSAGCVGGTFGNTSGASSISWSAGTIAAGSGINPGVCTITIKANAPLAAPIGTVYTNSIPAGSITGTSGSGGVSNTNTSSVNVTMIAAASVSKAFAPASVVQGGTSVLTVTMSNATATPLTNATLTDNLPAGSTVSSTPGTSTTCAGGVVSAAPLGGFASISGATIPANSNCNFKVNVIGSTAGTLMNTIPAAALGNDQGATNPSAASANLTVTSGLTATKTFSPTSVANGGVSQVDIRVTNPTISPLTSLSITDGPMTNLAVASVAGASTTCAGAPVITAMPGSNTVTMTGATLAAGANCDLLFNVVTSGNPANWPNSLPIGAIATAQGYRNTAVVSATLAKLSGVNIGINKSFSPVSVSAGEPSVLRIDLTNPVASPATVHNLSFSDTLPSGMQVYSNPAVSTTCTNGIVTAVPGSTSVSMTGATLASAATCSVFVTVTSLQFLNLTNTIPVGKVTTTEGLTNSVATTATLSTLQGLGVDKAFSPTSVSVGQPATLSMRLISTLDPAAAIPVTVHNATFTDTLPPGVTVAPTPNADTACVGGIVTAVPGANAVTVSGVSLPPGENCVSQVDVVAASLGTYVNTIARFAVTSDEGYVNQSDAQATLNVLLAPTIGKAFAPPQVATGVSSTLTITIGNTNALVLTNASLLDTLPSGLAIAPTPNASTTCAGGALAAPASGGTVHLTNGTIPANGSCTISVDVRSNTPNGYVNTIAIGALSTSPGASNTALATATLNVIGPPGVTKSFTPPTIQINQTSLLAIQLGNPNVVAATLTSPLIDMLPANLVVANPPNVGGTCTLASVAASAGGSTVTYAIGATIPVGGCTISVDVTSAIPALYTNTIPVNGLRTDLGNNGTAGSAALQVNPPPTTDLAVTKDDGAASVLQGATIAYTVVVTNNGPLAADGALINDPAAAGLAKTGVTCLARGGAACPATLGVAPLEGAGVTMGSFPPGGSATFTVTANVTALSGASVTNTATVTVPSGMVDSNPANNSASDTDNVTGNPDLAIAKSHAGNFRQGQAGAFTLDVSNAGNLATSGAVIVADTLPFGLAPTAIDGPGWTCSLAPLSCTRSDVLGVGASYPSITLTVQAAGNAGSSLVNTASVATAGDVNPANDAANDSVTVNVGPDLTIAKLHSGSFTRGSSGTFTLTVTNAGDLPSTGLVSVADAAPAGLAITSIGGSGWSCGATSCDRSDALGPGSSYPPIAVTVSVAASASSPLVNVASVSGGGDVNVANNSAGDSVTVTGNPDLAIAKSHAGNFTIGQTGTFTIGVSNLGASPTTGVVTVTDTLPAGMTASAFGGAGWSCTLTPLSCTRSDSLGAGASYPNLPLTVQVGVATPGAYANVATVATAGDPNAANDSAIDSVTVDGVVDLAIAKSATGNFVRNQTSGTFTLTVHNGGSAPTTGLVTVSDALPSGLAATAVHGAGWTCTLAPVACTRTDALAAGAAYPDITINVATAANAVSQLTNTATVATSGDADPSNDSASAQVIVFSGPDVAIAKTHRGNFARGGSGTFTLTVANVGDLATVGTIDVADAIPAGLTATSIAGTNWTCTLSPLACSRNDSLGVGLSYESIAITVDVSPTAANSLDNVATVSGGGDANPGNDVASDTVLPMGNPDLAITKVHVGNFTRGQVGAAFTIGVRNVGTLQTTAPVTVTDALPAGLTATAIAGAGWTCSLAPIPSCTRSDALAVASAYPDITLTADVASDATNPLVNAAAVSTPNDPNAANDTATDIVTVNAGPDLAVAKTHNGAFVRGQSATFTLTVTNIGDVPSAGAVTVADANATGFTVTAMAGAGWTCAAAQCTRSDALAAGTSYPAIVVTIAIDADAASPITNTVTVAGGGDTNPTNSAASDTVALTGAPDLALTKTHAGSFVRGQSGAMFTLAVGNLGNAPTTGTVTVTDTLPAGLTASAIAGAGWSCTLSPLACVRSDALAAGVSYSPVTLAVDVSLFAASTLVNTASVAATGDADASNDTATDSVSIIGGPDVAITKTHVGSFVRGQAGATFTLAVGNLGNAATSGTVTVTDTLPTGLTASAIAGAGWSCTLSPLACVRSDALAAGASYPQVSLTVDVSPAAASTLVNTANVAAAGDTNPANDTSPDTVSIIGGAQIALAKTHTGIFVRGGTGTFVLTVGNAGNAATSGAVTVADPLPSGLTALAVAGSGWTCALSPLSCVRSDPLAPGASYPPIALTVAIAIDAPPTLTNIATVAGGGSAVVVNSSDVVATSSTTPTEVPTFTAPAAVLLSLLVLLVCAASLRRRSPRR